MLEDTIAAIATPLGNAGIGIIRLSGPAAKDLALKIFRNKENKPKTEFMPYRMNYGFIIDKISGEKIDEVLVSFMKGPHSFTAEDIIEINCHGGIISTKKVLEVVLREGARIAEPGEFSKRAFLNGRIDLAQAESIVDIINAKTFSGLKVAVNQLEGNLSKKVRIMSQEILELLAFIEAGIDFPEDDIEEITIDNIKLRTQKVYNDIDKLLITAEAGKIYRDGISTAIVGKPNVGKSSLLNALLKENKAIVTDVPGTTRDAIEDIINIAGIPLKIIDTAGIRETDDFIERLGVEKAKKISEDADLVLFVLDAVQGLTEEDKDILKMLEEKKTIVIINKIDLQDVDTNKISEGITDKTIIKISAKEQVGIEELEKQITNLFIIGEVNISSETVYSNLRHKNALERAKGHLYEVLDTINRNMPTDCMAIDLKGVWECLGEITGDTLEEDIIDKIFKEFCLGK